VRTKWVSDAGLSVGFMVVVWILVFLWDVAGVIYADHQELTSQNRKLLDEKSVKAEERCWMQNVTIPPPRDLPKLVSSSEAIVFCNTKYSAPVAFEVDYDKEPIAVSPLLFPETRTVDARVALQGRKIFGKLNSPSILPYNIFVVRAHGSTPQPPIATKITMHTIDPDKP
jgi:hypothetical protein